jgi:hypothetical protein
MVIPDFNAVVVMTGGGMDANAVTPLIARAFKSDAPLSANADASRRLSQTLASVSAAPPALPRNAPPPFSQALAGQIWLLPPNPLGLQTLRVDFSTVNQATLLFGFANGTGEVHDIGLDGVPRLSPNFSSGLNVAVSGQWTDDAFVIDYDEVARINDYRLVLKPQAGGLTIHITERSGLADATIIAQAVAGVPQLASDGSRR